MGVSYSDYEKRLADQGAFHISAIAKVLDTQFDYFAQDQVRVKKPDISIQVNERIGIDKPFQITCTFVNPLPKNLTKGHFVIEGPGLGHPVTVKVKG